MKIFLSILIALWAVGAQAQSVDNDLPNICSKYPLLCLIVRAGEQPAKWCDVEIGQTSVKPAGQQCWGGHGREANRDVQTVSVTPNTPDPEPEPDPDPEPEPEPCEHDYKGGYKK